MLLMYADESRKEVLAWLGPIHTDDRYEICRNSRTEATCSWIFNKDCYTAWKSSIFPGNTAKLLWIHGPAGFGKSVLCAAIVDSLMSDGELCVCHFFCSSTRRSEETSSNILRSWISRLINREENLMNIAQEYVQNEVSQASPVSMWRLLALLIQNTSNCVFVVDGLDECIRTDDLQREISLHDRLSFLKELRKSVENTSCRVLIVSRDESDIRSQLSATKPQYTHLTLYEHPISTANVKEDVLLFSKHVVQTKLSNKSEDIKAEIAQQMTEKCDGMFLWVELQQRELRGGKNLNQLRKIVRDMPAGLKSVYESSWQSILSKPTHDRVRALKILRWATFAFRPLTVSEITEALIVPDDDYFEDLLDDLPDCIDNDYINDEVIDLCGSLIEVRGLKLDQPLETWTVDLKHFSVREFLFTVENYEMISDVQPGTTLWPQVDNNYLSNSCLRYLQQRMLNILEEPTRNQSFVDYAVECGFLHVSRKGTRYPGLINLVNEFFISGHTHFEAWRVRFEQVMEQKYRIYFKDMKLEGTTNQLHYAVWLGLEDTVSYLYQKSPELLNRAEGTVGTPLQAACFRGNTSLVTQLLQLGSDINQAGGLFGSALNAAVVRGALEICECLLDKGADTGLTTRENLMRKGNMNAVQLASLYGFVEVLRLLLDRENNMSIATNEGFTPLCIACIEGEIEVFRLLMARGATYTQSRRGDTPLMLACFNDHVQIVKELLDGDAQVTKNIQDNDGRTPLHAASAKGFLEVVKLLLESGASSSIAAHTGWTPLHAACNNGFVEVAKLFLNHGASTSVTMSSGQTPLYLACEMGHLEVVQLLLDRAAGTATANVEEQTPLCSASLQGSTEIVKISSNREDDLFFPANNNWTPIHVAIFRGHVELAKFLYHRGADPSTPLDNGWTPLHSACQEGHADLAEFLLSKDANLSIIATEETPLHAACRNGHVEVAKLLLSKNADISAVNERCWTPLHAACRNGHVEVAKLLLSHGACVSTFHEDGWTPLHYACWEGHVEIASLLVSYGASPSTVKKDGWTPLHTAVCRSQIEVVKMLLKTNVDPGITTTLSGTSLHIASQTDSSEMIALLVTHHANPLQLDGYGRSCLDWASMFQPCFEAMAGWKSRYIPTPDIDSRKILTETVKRLVDESLIESEPVVLNTLGHCLLLMDDERNSHQAFEHKMLVNEGSVQHHIVCNRCRQGAIRGSRYVCKACADADLCESCFEVFREDKKPWRCQKHEFLKVPRDGYGRLNETDDERQKRTYDWLCEVKAQYS